MAKWTIIAVGFVMLFKPILAKNTLRKVESTKLINYGKITLRIIPAAALIVSAKISKYPKKFKTLG